MEKNVQGQSRHFEGHCIMYCCLPSFNFTGEDLGIKEEFEDIKRVIRRQYNDQKKKNKWTNNDLQNTTQKTKDWATRTPLKTGVTSGAPEVLADPTPLEKFEDTNRGNQKP